MKRLLITGGSGYLGSHLIRAAEKWEVYATCYQTPVEMFRRDVSTHIVPLNLCDADAVRAAVATLRPAAIIHTACSNRTPEHTRAIVPAARNVARAAAEFNARLVHLSTDMVFDGEHAPYADNAPLSPITDYAQAKAEAETVVADLSPRAIIARPSLVWGLDPLDRQTSWLVAGTQSNQPVTLFTDEIRCPVYVYDLCATLLELAARPKLSGPMNVSGPQPLNRWELGVKLLQALSLAPGANVQPGTLARSGLVRPRNLTLLTPRADQALKAKRRTVDDVLQSLKSDA